MTQSHAATGSPRPAREPDGEPTGAAQPAAPAEAADAEAPAAADLPSSHEQLRLITDALPALISYVDAGQRYRFVNRAYERWFGRPAAEFVGRHLREVLGEEAYAAIRPHVERALAGEPVGYEAELAYRDGGPRHIGASYAPDVRPDGRVRGFVALVNDLTDRRRAEEALRRSEERYHALVTATASFVWVTAGGDGLLHEAPGWEAFTGQSVAEYQGWGWVEAAHPDDRERAAAVWRRALETGTPFEMVFRLRHRLGEYRYVRTLGMPMRGPDGAVREWIGTVTDIHDRYRAEQERERLDQHLRALLGSTAEGAWGVDRDGRCTFLNHTAERLFGYTSEEALGRNMHDLIHHSRPDGTPYPETECPIYRALQSGEANRGEDVFWRRDGTAFPAEYTAHPLVERGEVSGAVVTFVDATERKRTEERLRQTDRLETVGRLAGGVAHEANNQMSVVLGCTEFILRHPDVPAAVREDAEQIRRAAERTAAVTAQLLAFSRRQVLRPRVVDLNALVAELGPVLRRTLGERSTLAVALAPDAGPVRADPGQLEQVLLNLALNARDAMPGGGQLTIATRNAAPDEPAIVAAPGVAVRPGPYVALIVSDSGHGMDRETLSHVFEPFFTTKPTGKGTGLGLSTVYGIVKQSGGYIWVASEPGRGTAFRIYLPRAEAAERPDRRAPPGAPAGAGEAVLVAEDDPLVRATMRRALADAGYRVLEAEHGAAAIALLEAGERPDLVLADLAMPGMDGRALAERLAVLRPGLPVLFTSGYTDDEVTRRGLLATGQPFLQKPFTPDVLARRVRETLAASRHPT